MKEKMCCFFGHRDVEETDELKNIVYTTVKQLIEEENVSMFLFGSKSDFDSLCLDIVTELKNEYPNIQRIYVRAEYPYISEEYRNHLLKSYDDTYYPEKLINAGKAIYVERNQELIDHSDFCVIYYNESYLPPERKKSKSGLSYQPKSGTKLAYEYAKSKEKNILNVYCRG